jgi:predicted component of type VI protein secretion system
MKVSLVVASGVHQGKAIPVAGAQFLIGREEGCQLRPASPAISKKHCAVLVRDGRVFVEDYGSTNGTFLNDEPVVGEVEVAPDDRLRVGPLDFRIDVKRVGPSDSTPLPEALKATAPAPKLTPAAQPPVPKPTPAAAQAPAPKPAPAPRPKGSDDDVAAMLLGMDEDDPAPADVPGGSTIMEMAPVDAAKLADAKAAEQKKVIQQASSKDAASELLRKYMRRPR